MKYLEESSHIKTLLPGELYETAKRITYMLKDNYVDTFEDCIVFALRHWHKNYRDEIAQLVYNFPEDHKTREGALFWSGAKKCPIPLKFDKDNDIHYRYIESLANLWAEVFRIEGTKNKTFITSVLQDAMKTIPEFKPKNNIKISASDEEEKNKTNDVMDMDMTLDSLPDPTKYKHLNLKSLAFEKDDDTNYHIDFIMASSNLRALNYKIKTIDFHTTKGIAGKIIPAIATTTAIVAGLVSLELYKLLHGYDKIDKYRNTYLNLALPLLSYSEPGEVVKTKINDNEYTMWDSLNLEGPLTIKQLVALLQEKYNGEILMISYGSMVLYSTIFPNTLKPERMKMNVENVVEELKKEKLNIDLLNLTIELDTDDLDLDVPNVTYNIK